MSPQAGVFPPNSFSGFVSPHMTATSCVFPPMSSFYTLTVATSQLSTHHLGSNKDVPVTPIPLSPAVPITIFPSSSPNGFTSAPTYFVVSPFFPTGSGGMNGGSQDVVWYPDSDKSAREDKVTPGFAQNCCSDQESSSSGFPIIIPSSSPSASTPSFLVFVQVQDDVHEPSPPLNPGLSITQLNNIGSIQCQSPMLVQRLSSVLPQAHEDGHGEGPVLNSSTPHVTGCHAENQRVVPITHESNTNQAARMVPHPNPCVRGDNNLGTGEVFGDCISAESLGDFSNNTENLFHDEPLERSSPLSGVNLDEPQLGLPAQSGMGISYSLVDLDTSTTNTNSF
ncbi:hypothetical protein V6N11_017083 [Hibiscus sabdariffa]|uniref:Uncharacterized protein n=1 Tax=Hibiscus sabdariffa TaxID=183260 RepID=A0ABR2TWY9_9ROSI